MMASATVRIKVVVTNEKALRALAFAAEQMKDIAEDMPWRDDAQEAWKALRYAARHIAMVEDRER